MQKPNVFESPNILDIKSVTEEHPKTSPKLSKTISQAGKVSKEGSGKSSKSHLYSKTKKVLDFWMQK